MSDKQTIHAHDLHISSFEQYLHSLSLTSTTIRNYLADVRDFARWLGKRERARLNRVTFREYREHLRRSTHSRATVNRRLHTLHLYGGFLRAQGIVSRDPSVELEFVHVKKKGKENAPGVLAAVQVERLREAVRQHARPSLFRRDRAIVELMLDAGLRVNEIAQLRVDSLTIGNRGLSLIVGSNSHLRQVPVTEALAHVLRDYHAARPKIETNSALFISQQGKPLSPRAIQRLVEEYARAADLAEVSASTLRHTCAQNLLNEKRDPHMVAQLLGTRSTESLARYKIKSGV